MSLNEHGLPMAPPNPSGRLTGHILATLVIALFLLSPLAAAANGGGPDVETISGTVYDERGTPKDGVRVVIEGTSIGMPTDEDGAFELSGTSLEGSVTLGISADGYLTATMELDLEEGEWRTVSIYLVEVESAPSKVEGLVQTVEGEPYEGALVTLALEDDVLASTLTDVDGWFSLSIMTPVSGQYTVTAEANGYSISTFEFTTVPGKNVSITIFLVPEVPTEIIVGHVVDTRGLPLPGAIVTVAGTSGAWATDMEGLFRAKLSGRLGSREVSVSLRGYVTVTTEVGVPDPGIAWVNLTLTSDGLGGDEHLWVQVQDARTSSPIPDVTVTIANHEGEWSTDSGGLAMITTSNIEGPGLVRATKDSHTVAEAEFHLEDGGSTALRLLLTRTSNAVSLVGTVVDADTGAPLEGAVVNIDASGVIYATVTDEEGAFSVHDLPPEVPTIITARVDGYSTGLVEVKPQEYSVTVIEIALSVTRDEPISLSGWIFENTLHGPVSGAQVTLWKDGYLVVLRSDEAGTLTVHGIPTDGGPLQYYIEHRDFVAASGTLSMPDEGEPLALEVGLEPLTNPKTVVRGRVLDPDGFSVEDAQVSLTLGHSTWETRSVDGVYELFLSLDGDFTADMSATGVGYGWHNQTPTVGAHSISWVNFTLPLGRDMSNVLGIVATYDHKPVVGAEVFLSMGGAFLERAVTGPDGSFAFRLVPTSDDPFQLSAVAEGYSGVTLDAMAKPGRTTRYNLTVREDLTTFETIQGRVTNAEGTPMASAVVRVEGANPVLTDRNGTFVIVGTDLDGPRTISASSPGFETLARPLDMKLGSTVWIDLTLKATDSRVTTVGGRVLRASDGSPMEGARVTLGLITASSSTFETVTDAQGAFIFRGVPRAWGSVILKATAVGYYNDHAKGVLPETEGYQVTFSMQRIIVKVPVEPFISSEEAKTIGVGAGATVATLAVLALTEVGRVALLVLFFLPLYTKIRRDKVMDHFVRGRIYEYITNNPGVNYSAIKKRFDLTNGTVTYHLSMLERQEFIRSKQDGIYKRYFRNDGGAAMYDVTPMSVQLSIAKIIRKHPGLTQKEVAIRLNTSKQLISYHIKRMREDGLLDTRRDGRAVRVYANNETPE